VASYAGRSDHSACDRLLIVEGDVRFRLSDISWSNRKMLDAIDANILSYGAVLFLGLVALAKRFIAWLAGG
jgi:hypothetical protein